MEFETRAASDRHRCFFCGHLNGMDTSTRCHVETQRHRGHRQPTNVLCGGCGRGREVAEPILDNQAFYRPVFQGRVMRHQRRLLLEGRARDHKIEVALRSSDSLKLRPHDGVPIDDSQSDVEHRQRFGEPPHASAVLLPPR
jgi:hypothetical protein